MSRDRHDHPSAEALEAFAFSSGDPDQSAIRAHVTTCAACSQLVKTLQENRAAFLAARPVSAFMASLDERADPPAWWQRLLRPGPAIALAAGLAAAGLVFVSTTSTEPSNGVKFKGGATFTLRLHVSRDGGAAAPFDVRDALFPNDVIRFVADLPEAGHVSIVSLDEAGELSFYYPPRGIDGAREAGRSTVLPGAIQLDDYLGTEVIIMTVADSPLDQEVLRSRILDAFEVANRSLEVAHRRSFGPDSVSILIRKQAAP